MWISGANGQWPKEVKDSAVGGPRPIWLPDGRLAWQTPDRQNYRIRDLWTGRDEYLFTDAVGRSLGLDPTFSPRGDQLVLRWNRYEPGLLLLSWPSREERLLARQLRPIRLVRGRRVDLRDCSRGGGPSSGCRRERAGPKQSANFPSALNVNTCDLTPDRDVIVCSLIEEKSDAWVMENFDPGIF